MNTIYSPLSMDYFISDIGRFFTEYWWTLILLVLFVIWVIKTM